MSQRQQGSAGLPERLVPHTRIEDDSKIEDKYKLGRKLGHGSFGVVKEGTNIKTEMQWAIKAVNKEKAGSSAIKLLEREVAILKRVQHKHIIHLEEVYETAKRMYLVMEICDMELADLLKQKGTCTEAETKIIVSRLASAISYLHKNDIVHRDLKLENILLSHDPQDPDDKLHVKVTDFGLSVVKGGVGHDNMLQEFCGTPIYMSPEIIDNKTYSQQCDVWAMGVITFNLLSGQPPFKAKDEETLYELIKKGEFKFPENISKEISEEAKNCICGMLKCDPAHRLTASEVLNSPWITGKDASTHPTNVLEMMRQWGADLKLQSDESAINGEEDKDKESSMTTEETTTHNEEASDKVSAVLTNSTRSDNNNDKKKSPTSGSSSPSGKRNSTKTSNKLRSHIKRTSPQLEKSPVGETSHNKPTTGPNASSKRQSHHAAKTAATPTSKATPSSSKRK